MEGRQPFVRSELGLRQLRWPLGAALAACLLVSAGIDAALADAVPAAGDIGCNAGLFNGHAVGAAISRGGGDWLTDQFGDVATSSGAPCFGSLRTVAPAATGRPVVGVAADAAAGGYWLAAADGGVFSFNAPF